LKSLSPAELSADLATVLNMQSAIAAAKIGSFMMRGGAGGQMQELPSVGKFHESSPGSLAIRSTRSMECASQVLSRSSAQAI
jgi:hypothetical protein